MNNEISNIFSKSTCPSQDSLLQYVKGTLSDKAKRDIEKHLTDCEMCSDEVEGLSLLNKPEEIDNIEFELNAKIDTLIKKRENKNYGFFFKIAATVVLVLGLSTVIYFQINQKKEVISRVENLPVEKKVDGKDLAIIDSSKIVKNAELLIGGDQKAEKEINEDHFTFKSQEESQMSESKQLLPVAGAISQPVTTGYFSNDNFVDVVAANETNAKIVTKADADEAKAKVNDDLSGSGERNVLKKESKVVVQDLEAQEDKPVAVGNSPQRALEQAGLVSESDKKGSKDKLRNEKTKNEETVTKGGEPPAFGQAATTTAADGDVIYTTNLLQEVIEKVNSNKYNEALTLLETYPLKSNDGEKALFYKGLCYYKLNNPKKASAIFKELEKNKSLALYNDIQWYYALSLLSLDKKHEASKILEDIIKNKSPYAPKAQEEIDKLK